MTKNLIYIGGDSFMEGDEIADSFLEGFPGWQDLETYVTNDVIEVPPDIQEWTLATWDHETKNGWIKAQVSNKRRDVNLCLSVSGELRSRLECDVYSNARAGASMDGIARRTVADLSGFSRGYDRIIAFIGITDVARRSIPSVEDFNYSQNRFHTDIIPWTNINDNEYIASMQKFLRENSYYYHDIMNFLLNAVAIKNHCDALGIELHWINPQTNLEWYNWVITKGYKDPHFLVSEHSEEWTEWQKSNPRWSKWAEMSDCQDYINLRDYLNFDKTLSLWELAYDVRDKVYAPAGHYSPNVHEEMANRFMPYILDGNYASLKSHRDYGFRQTIISDFVADIEKYTREWYERPGSAN